VTQAEHGARYAEYFPRFIKKGVEAELLDEKLAAVRPARVWARRSKPSATCSSTTSACRPCTTATSCTSTKTRIELPQAFFMRVAMGLALNEVDREARAIEFYERAVELRLHVSSTPTLFNCGTLRSQLSSLLPDHGGRRPRRHLRGASRRTRCCPSSPAAWATTGRRCARWARHIKGTNGKSQGVVPFLKVVNDTAVAVNQGGKRKGAVCAYLETWHLDIEEFLELRKNTGDDRRRTHDMNTANWIPDLFMKRVMEGGDWTLFSPSDLPRPARQVRQGLRGGLHRLRGQGRPRRAQALQAHAGHGPVAQDAVDAVRDRPSLDHLQGRLQRALARSSTSAWCTRSNLCTEITLNTNDDRDRGVQPRVGQPARST
jgi:ribonucleoside-diphosphate reductase alpha chain